MLEKFFLNKVKENIQHYNIYSASSLIQRYQPATDAGYKKVHNVNNNQDILIKAIIEERRYAEELQKKYQIGYIIISHECIGNQFERVLQELGGDYY